MTEQRCTLLCQVKEEGWWLVVSDANETEVLALKRLSFGSHTSVRLTIPEAAAVDEPGSNNSCVMLHLVSDSYIGMDQRHTVRWGHPTSNSHFTQMLPSLRAFSSNQRDRMEKTEL